MTEGPWDGSEMAPEAVVPPVAPPTGGGGGGRGGPAAARPLDAAADVGAWPEAGVKPALGGWML